MSFSKHNIQIHEQDQKEMKHMKHYLALVQLLRREAFNRLKSSGEGDELGLPFEGTDEESSCGTPRERQASRLKSTGRLSLWFETIDFGSKRKH